MCASADKPATVVVVSGGSGASGSLLVRTALAQFSNADVSVVVMPNVREADQVRELIDQSAAAALVVHTLVDPALRQELVGLARQRSIATLDPMGPLLDQLAALLGEQPAGWPGHYHRLHAEDLKRIDAIEYSVAHDDGQRSHEWGAAEIVLVGVSRVGKTPLSMYLAMLGWKVANVPLVRELGPPALLRLERRRVIGLTIDRDQLAIYRAGRASRLQVGTSSYADPEALEQELEDARRLFRRYDIPVINVTDKPIEAIANEVTALIKRRGA